jgi:predicted DNA-binding transcriptional regulator YafY
LKLDRMLSIITILLQKDKVTAPELAEKLEVSRRTIHRDIDAICRAGIPIITRQGGGGGIQIADGFRLDKSVLTVEELQQIITGLKSLGSVSETSHASQIERLIHRLSPGGEAVVSMQESILIDLASHYKGSLSEKISLIKSAISESRLISFTYYSDKGKTLRTIEPYYLAFKWSSWYVFGYCRTSNDFRLFKINRMWHVEKLPNTYQRREIPPEKRDLDRHLHDQHRLTLLVDKELEYLLVDEYGPNFYETLEDGRLRAVISYTNRDYIVSWIMSMGEKAQVLEPEDIAQEIREKAKKMLTRYEQDKQLSCS